MNKAQKVVTGFLIVSILIIAMLFFIAITQKKNYYPCDNVNLSAQTILYYGVTCPHCKIVEQWISENNATEKINITQIEVFQNQTNGEELLSLGTACKLPPDYMGAVPLLYTHGRAYIGDKDIINFLKKQLGVR